MRIHKISFCLLLSALVLVPLCGCGREERPPMPNIVLVVIDALRADHLPFHGYDLNTSPFLDELAASSVVFDNAFAASSWTAPATASIFTSTYPFQHNVNMGIVVAKKANEQTADTRINRIPDSMLTIAEKLKAAGYRTFAVADNPNIGEMLGFHQGFDQMVTRNYETAEFVNEQVLSWEESLKGSEPYFLYLHYMDPHKPLHARAPIYPEEEVPSLDEQTIAEEEDAGRRDEMEEVFRTSEIRKYDSEIHYVDEKIKELVQHFRWDEETLLIVTSDHGEGLWDHGVYTHGHSLFTEVIRVPLLILLPKAERMARRVANPVGTIDIFPTVVDYLGLTLQEKLAGMSLLPLIHGNESAPRERGIFSHLKRQLKDGHEIFIDSVLYRDWKLHRNRITGQYMLFNLMNDPEERVNIFTENEKTGYQLENMYKRLLKRSKKYGKEYSELETDEEFNERIKELGYVQ